MTVITFSVIVSTNGESQSESRRNRRPVGAKIKTKAKFLDNDLYGQIVTQQFTGYTVQLPVTRDLDQPAQ